MLQAGLTFLIAESCLGHQEVKPSFRSGRVLLHRFDPRDPRDRPTAAYITAPGPRRCSVEGARVQAVASETWCCAGHNQELLVRSCKCSDAIHVSRISWHIYWASLVHYWRQLVQGYLKPQPTWQQSSLESGNMLRRVCRRCPRPKPYFRLGWIFVSWLIRTINGKTPMYWWCNFHCWGLVYDRQPPILVDEFPSLI